MERKLRILAGKKKGLKLYSPQQEITRLTLSRIKQSLFDILNHNPLANNWKKGGFVVDVFAGSGSLAYEALSRGAFKICCIERSELAINALKKNKDLFLSDKAFENHEITLIDKNFFKLNKLNFPSPDLIFIDPPYNIYTARDLVYQLVNIFDLTNSVIVYQRPTVTEDKFKLASLIDEKKRLSLDEELLAKKFEIIKQLVITNNTFDIFKLN